MPDPSPNPPSSQYTPSSEELDGVDGCELLRKNKIIAVTKALCCGV